MVASVSDGDTGNIHVAINQTFALSSFHQVPANLPLSEIVRRLEQIRPDVPGRYSVLGIDGFGRSDTRHKLRGFFEVDRYSTCIAALFALAEQGAIDRGRIGEAIRKYGIDPDKIDPASV